MICYLLFAVWTLMCGVACFVSFRAGRRIGHQEGYDMKKFSGHVTEAFKAELRRYTPWHL